MKLLLTLTAVFESLTGLALLIIPSVVVSLLLGTPLTETSGMLVSRVGGAALISLAIACLLSRESVQSSLVIIKAFVFYNASAASLLIYAAVIENVTGIGLWPAVLLHSGLLIWCVKELRNHKNA